MTPNVVPLLFPNDHRKVRRTLKEFLVQKKKYRFVIATLVAAFFATGLTSLTRVQSGDPPPKSTSDKPPVTKELMPAPFPAQRVFLQPLAQPTVEGNARIRVGEGLARTVSLNLDRLQADQKRYAENLEKAKQVVILKGQGFQGARWFC